MENVELKTYFRSTIPNYENTKYDIEAIFFDPVFEEDLSESNQKQDNDPSFGQKMKETVEKLMKTLLAIINRYATRVTNIFNRLMQSDKGFRKKIRIAIRDNKPLEGIKLVSYQHNDQFLDMELNKISSIIPQYIKEMTAEKSEIDEETESMEHLVLKKMGVSSDITNMNLYWEYVKKQYRNEKKEMVFRASEKDRYYNEALSYDKTKNIINSKQAVMSQQANVVKIQLKRVLEDKNISKEVKRATTKRIKNVTQLYNIYTTFLDFYFQLKIEKFMTYREVLKKLYHIN